jgi:hypothetical protein
MFPLFVTERRINGPSWPRPALTFEVQAYIRWFVWQAGIAASLHSNARTYVATDAWQRHVPADAASIGQHRTEVAIQGAAFRTEREVRGTAAWPRQRAGGATDRTEAEVDGKRIRRIMLRRFPVAGCLYRPESGRTGNPRNAAHAVPEKTFGRPPVQRPAIACLPLYKSRSSASESYRGGSEHGKLPEQATSPEWRSSLSMKQHVELSKWKTSRDFSSSDMACLFPSAPFPLPQNGKTDFISTGGMSELMQFQGGRPDQ